ncbi:MAG: type 1 glutamine amidotransferase [Thermoleophilia bacterium]|nr:type 1 glutamine amidotransferase [Thermoleophilia bacterium]
MTVLFVEHVPWEGPHRIAERLGGAAPALTVNPLAGGRLPDHASIAAAVFMGGPMSVNETDAHPELADEVRWIELALERGLPLLGVCLGSQLIARALGAPVGVRGAPELGWAPVDIHAPADPLLGPLAPLTTVLHWHGESFPTPAGAELLASSSRAECQGFRAGSAWGVLFHPEADGRLVRSWLAEPSMAAEAERALGPDASDLLLAGAARHEAALVARSGHGFDAFAGLIAGDGAGARAPRGGP